MLPVFALFMLLSACKKDETDYAPIDKKIIEDYLSAKGLTATGSTTSGIYYIIAKAGGQNHPNASSAVSVNYKGYLTNDTVFDESYSAGTPSSFQLSSVIAGWQEGIPLFGVGGKGTLLIPSELGYGATEKTGIPAHSVLIFDIELVDYW